VIGCHVYNNLNTTFGALLLNGGSTALNNVVYANQGTGIHATGSCTIIGNNCSFNGNGGDGAGILTTFTRNRIEGNTVFNNDRGIDVNTTLNLIIRNHASGNTGTGTPNADYDIAGGNDYGQIITLTGAGSFVSTDPNANIRR
jgi:parallel beta-helix repeat protein